MSLEDYEDRELARIEEQLRKSDPWLDSYLAGANVPTRRFGGPAVTLAVFVVVAVLLLIGGVFWRDTNLLVGGAMILASVPACVALFACARSSED